MGFMISFDGRATLTSDDERHSTRDIELMGGGGNDWYVPTKKKKKKKNTVNAPPILLKNLHKTVKRKKKTFLSIEIIDKNPTLARSLARKNINISMKIFPRSKLNHVALVRRLHAYVTESERVIKSVS